MIYDIEYRYWICLLVLLFIIELSCDNLIKCANCQGNHPADSTDCLVWKKEKEINTIKYTNNISFQEARKLIQSDRLQHPTQSRNMIIPADHVIRKAHPSHT